MSSETILLVEDEPRRRMTQLMSQTLVPALTIRTFRDYDAGVRWLTME